MQTIIFNNLCFRLKSFHFALQKEEHYKKSLESFNFNSLDQLYIILNNKFSYSANFSKSFYLLKRNGLSFHFNLPYFYNKCLFSLYNNSLVPVIDSNADRFFYSAYRPFRNSKEIVTELLTNFSKKYSFSFFFNLQVSFSFFDNSWLFKNFPMNKKITKLLLMDLNLKDLQKSKFLINIFNFLLDGLVCFI